jgi:hypothetical protein
VKHRFQLDELYTQFPDLVFVHFVRNPLDLAAAVGTNLQTLRSQVVDFKSLYGGFGGAADVMLKRCEVIHPHQERGESACMLNHKELKKLTECWKFTCPAPIGAAQEPWGCLVSMLWAEINTMVHAFGKRCLSTNTRRYIVFHGEDVLGLRGPGTKAKLQAQLAEALHADLAGVQAVFLNVSGAPQQPIFGKYTQFERFVESNHRCAESAEKGVFRSFGYESSSGVGTYDFDSEVVLSQKRKHQSGMLARLRSAPAIPTAAVLLLAAVLAVILNKGSPSEGGSITRGDITVRAIIQFFQNFAAFLVLAIFSLTILYLAYLSFQEYALPVLAGGE